MPGVRCIFLDEAEKLARPHRTVYRVDVRTPEEYAAGHLPGFPNVPGGQLVQETDHTAPVRGALVLLTDDDGTRANMTASWLAQMGWETYVVDAAASDWYAEDTPAPRAAPTVPEVEPKELQQWLSEDGTVVIDVGTSANYVKGHVPDAWWALRSQLQPALKAVGPAGRYVVTCDSGALAPFAAEDLKTLTSLEVYVLAGGTNAWRDSSLPLAVGEERLASARIDRDRRPYEGTDAPREAMEAYLDWEYGLVEQLRRHATHFFHVI
jgi:rhodanese-related sulfurtransferase